MPKKILILSILVLAVAAGGSAAAADIDTKALAEHVRESYNIPAMVNVAFSDPKDSGIPGFKKMKVMFSMRGMEQGEDLFISKDGRHYLMGGFKDLSVHPDNERLKKIDYRDSASRGNKDAPVLIVEYSDFQCFFCQKGYRIMRDRILKEYPGKVRWVYKSYPLTNIHPWGKPAAVAAECALLQGEDKFWALHDLLFDHQKEIKFSNFEEKLAELAKKTGLDTAKLDACLDSKRTLPKVSRDMAEAGTVGVSAAPAFLVNGHKVSGADYEGLKRVIEECLQGKHGKL